MKAIRYILVIIVIGLLHQECLSQVKDTTFSKHRTETNMSKGHFVKIKINYCDEFTVVFSGFYHVLKDLLPIDEDKLYLTDFLKSKGFKVVKTASGKWDKGPRYIEVAMKNDNCNCTLFKLYYDYKQMKDGYYTFTVKEKLVCNQPVTGINE